MQDKRMISKFMIVVTAILIGVGPFIPPTVSAQSDAPKAFAGIFIDPDTVKPFDLVANIMEIHQGDKPYLVVAEKIIWVTEYDFLDKIFRTEVVNKNGRPIKLSDLKIDQVVKVTGLELADKTIVGQQIQVESK